MEDMGNKAGATQTAYEKLAGSLDERINKVMGRLGNIVLTVGHAVLTAAVPAMEAFATVAEFVGQNTDLILVALATMAGAALPAAISGLTVMAGMLGTTATAASGLAVEMWAAMGPWGILADLAAGAAAAFVLFSGKTDVVKSAMNETHGALQALNGELAIFYTTSSPKGRQGRVGWG